MKSNLNKDGGKKEEAHGRCGCGSLLFRPVPGGIEIKCRRCKRVHVVKI